MRRIIDLAFNQGDLTCIDALVAISKVSHTLSADQAADRSWLKQTITAYRIGFPDLHCTIEDEISANERFAALWTMRGTHHGLFMGNAPTGRPMQTQGLIFARLEERKIAAYSMMTDQFGLLQQLGIIPG
jgi:predicted ester cyclase